MRKEQGSLRNAMRESELLASVAAQNLGCSQQFLGILGSCWGGHKHRVPILSGAQELVASTPEQRDEC